tara:strand:+ start:105 stop:584 length:480 start_codon:yes stop_codon:yes gene_type:complete
MAESIPGGFTFDPSVASVAMKITDYIGENSIPVIAEQAHNVIMMDWANEQGYSSDGSPFSWQRSPKSKRKNPILSDTGVLQSSIDIVFFDDGFEFKFEVSGGSIYKSGATVEEVSSYNDYNPHTNVPAEYMPGGSEWNRIIAADVIQKINDLMSEGKIY